MIDKQRAVYLMLWPDKCWHEWPDYALDDYDFSEQGDAIAKYYYKCPLCGDGYGLFDFVNWRTDEHFDKGASNPNLTTWPGFGLMWERAQECKWYGGFTWRLSQKGDPTAMFKYVHDLINPTRFLDALYEFGVATNRIKEG